MQLTLKTVLLFCIICLSSIITAKAQSSVTCSGCTGCTVKKCDDCEKILADIPKWIKYMNELDNDYYKTNAILYETYNPLFGPLFAKVAVDNAGDIKNGRLAAATINDKEAKLALAYTWTFGSDLGNEGDFNALGLSIDGNVKNNFSSILSSQAVQSGFGISVNYMFMGQSLSFFHDDELEQLMAPGRDTSALHNIRTIEKYLTRFNQLRCDSTFLANELESINDISKYDKHRIKSIGTFMKKIDSIAFVRNFLSEFKEAESDLEKFREKQVKKLL